MRGFKDDFYAWKETLSSEDQALLLKQAQNEFNKKFRGSDDFKASVAEDKIESFGKVLQKFFDTEREDYKKDAAAKIPDYDYLVKKAGQVGYDFSLKPAIVEVDRDADRRWSFATDKMKLAEDKGETFSDSAPLEDRIFWVLCFPWIDVGVKDEGCWMLLGCFVTWLCYRFEILTYHILDLFEQVRSYQQCIMIQGKIEQQKLLMLPHS